MKFGCGHEVKDDAVKVWLSHTDSIYVQIGKVCPDCYDLDAEIQTKSSSTSDYITWETIVVIRNLIIEAEERGYQAGKADMLTNPTKDDIEAMQEMLNQ